MIDMEMDVCALRKYLETYYPKDCQERYNGVAEVYPILNLPKWDDINDSDESKALENIDKRQLESLIEQV